MPSVDARYKRALELFNEGAYFECHEVLESLWLNTPSEDQLREFYKGVIQAAAALYQVERGVLSGARGLFRSASGYLRKYEPVTLGLNVSKLIEDLATVSDVVPTTGRRPAKLTLEFNLEGYTITPL